MTTRALVTGFSGFVGSHLADYLLEHTDWKIYGLIRWRSSLDNIAHLLPRINNNDRIHLLYGDLRDSDSINNSVRECKPDYVFHLAAQSYPKTSFTSALDTYETNVHGTSRVLEALRQYSPEAVIHVCSSSEVFGRVSQDKLPINEECSFHPASPYAISKVGTDLIGRFYAEAYNMKVMTTRMFTHTGPRRGDVFAESSFAKQIAMVEAGQAETIYHGNLNSLRTWADVRDAVRAYYLLVTKNPVSGAYYNIGGNYTRTVDQVMWKLIGMSKLAKQKYISTAMDLDRCRPIDADLQVPDCSKFKAHTGWEPKIPFDVTMQDLLEYWRGRIKNGGKFLTR